MFDHYLDLWELEPDGEPIVTRFSRLLPVHLRGTPAMLKLLLHEEERTGSAVLAWWGGNGAVRVLARDGDGLLLERAAGNRSLVAMATQGDDDTATRTICGVANRLHAPRPSPPPSGLPLLKQWFAPLEPFARERGGIIATAQQLTERLLATEQDVRILHGDLHHDNVLDAGERGWLAIDPKGIVGERTFDFVNILRNPVHYFGDDRERLSRQSRVIAESASLDDRRLLQWTAAFCGLSAAWILTTEPVSDRDRWEAEGDLALLRAALDLLEQEEPA